MYYAIIVFFCKVIAPVKTGRIIDLKITISSNSFWGSKLSLITLCWRRRRNYSVFIIIPQSCGTIWKVCCVSWFRKLPWQSCWQWQWLACEAIIIIINIIIINITKPKPTYGRQGLAGGSLHGSGGQLGNGKWWFFVTNTHTNTHFSLLWSSLSLTTPL